MLYLLIKVIITSIHQQEKHKFQLVLYDFLDLKSQKGYKKLLFSKKFLLHPPKILPSSPLHPNWSKKYDSVQGEVVEWSYLDVIYNPFMSRLLLLFTAGTIILGVPKSKLEGELEKCIRINMFYQVVSWADFFIA